MRAVVVANTYPTPDHPYAGTDVDLQIRSLRAAGIEVDMLPVDRIGGGMGVYRGLGAIVAERVTEIGADLVHVSYGGVMAYEVVRSLRAVPTIVTYRGTDLLGGDAGGLSARVREIVGVLASRRAAFLATSIIVVSQNLRDALPRTITAPVATIPFGIDFSQFSPVERSAARETLGWPDDRTYVLFPASPKRPEKRYSLAEAAVRALGRDDVELKALEAVNPTEVPLWFNACDVTLLTSTHEGSPNVVKESLACMTPVVSVDVGDVREQIEGLPGCAVVATDARALAAAIEAAVGLPRSDEGRARIASLDLETVADRVMAVYRQALADAASPASVPVLA